MLPPRTAHGTPHKKQSPGGQRQDQTDEHQQLTFVSGGRRLRAQVISGVPAALSSAGVSPRAGTIFLLHGWGGHGGQFSAFVEPLVSVGFRVVIPDLPAHGRSAGKITNAFEMRQAVLDLALHVGQPDAVIAHSFGAMVTALALDAGLAPQACAFVAPMTSFDFAVQSFAAALGLSDAARERMLQHFEARFGISGAGMEVAQAAGSRFTRRGGDQSLPLLVVHDADDGRVPIELGQTLVESWPGAELHATSGLGHQRILNDAAVVDELVRFVTVTAQGMADSPTKS